MVLGINERNLSLINVRKQKAYKNIVEMDI